MEKNWSVWHLSNRQSSVIRAASNGPLAGWEVAVFYNFGNVACCGCPPVAAMGSRASIQKENLSLTTAALCANQPSLNREGYVVVVVVVVRSRLMVSLMNHRSRMAQATAPTRSLLSTQYRVRDDDQKQNDAFVKQPPRSTITVLCKPPCHCISSFPNQYCRFVLGKKPL